MENQEISKIILNTLKSHRETETSTLYLGKANQYSYLLLSYLEGEREITEKEAKEMIRKLVNELNPTSDTPLFLYTCKDNAEISIDKWDGDDYMDVFFQQADNFYIGFD